MNLDKHFKCGMKGFMIFFKQKGFEQCKLDTSIYVLMEWEQVFYLVLYVDDLLSFSKCVDAIKMIKTTLSKKFDLTNLGKFTFCWGIQMIRYWLKKMINHGQVEYIGTKMLRWFRMQESKSITTPFEINVQLSMEQALGSKKETIEMGKIPHEATIGSIIYAMIATRPNIVATIRIVSQFIQNPIYTR